MLPAIHPFVFICRTRYRALGQTIPRARPSVLPPARPLARPLVRHCPSVIAWPLVRLSAVRPPVM